MFSQLGPLFKTQFRQAESNDTRQYIPHEERDQNRRKNEDAEKKAKEEPWTDDTTVSVNALRIFLIDFLKTLPGGDDMTFTKNDTTPHRPHEQKRPTNTHNAKAVRAYQTMASYSHHEASAPEPEENKNPTADKLQSKELRDIHALIKDLENLEKRGITDLNILKAPSFIEGMKQAVDLQNGRQK